MAARIVEQLIQIREPVRIMGNKLQLEYLQGLLGSRVEYVELWNKERRYELIMGWLKPQIYFDARRIYNHLKGCKTLTVINGVITANHALTLSAALAARLLDIKAWIYYPMIHEATELGLSNLQSVSYRRALNRLTATYKNFVTIDSIWRERLLDKCLCRPLDVRIIHNFIDLKYYENLHQIPAIETRPRRICFIGRFDSYQKGLDLLVDTLHHLRTMHMVKPTQFVFVGSGEYQHQLHKYCNKLAGGQLSFEFHGWKKSAIPIMNSCDALVLPSRLEGVPTVVAEALMLGLPVFAYSIPGATSLLDKKQLIAPFDTKAMAEVISAPWPKRQMGNLSVSNKYLMMLRDSDRFRREVKNVFDYPFKESLSTQSHREINS